MTSWRLAEIAHTSTQGVMIDLYAHEANKEKDRFWLSYDRILWLASEVEKQQRDTAAAGLLNRAATDGGHYTK